MDVEGLAVLLLEDLWQRLSGVDKAYLQMAKTSDSDGLR
jgi:hypothetical protein